MDARVSTNISLAAETDISVVTAPSGATWIELGSAAVFADKDQLRRLNAVLTDHLSEKPLARTIASDLREDR